MILTAGIDIGNSSTEACIASISEEGKLHFISSSITKTTGVKGTIQNVDGIITVLKDVMNKSGYSLEDLKEIRINEAAPVIGDTAMETITETIITESAMIGHNPSTPGGIGIGIGYTAKLHELMDLDKTPSYIVIIPESFQYEEAAKQINNALEAGYSISGAVVQRDEAVLINNRINKIIPIVDEVKHIENIPLNSLAAVEVAESGYTIRALCNPYDIASIFSLDHDQTRQIVPVAKSLIGTRSAVVIKTPSGEVKEKIIPAGSLNLKGTVNSSQVNLDFGAEEIMKNLAFVGELQDVEGESGTNVSGMINSVKSTMSQLTGETVDNIRIKDILAVDTFLPVRVSGGLAGETFMEKAVGLAVMVKTNKLPMLNIAKKLEEALNINVKIAGIEAVMAVMGALTTPGVGLPLAILDLGAGSTDAAIVDRDGYVNSIHLAGAGEMVTMLINSELGLNDRNLAEEIKKYPLAKVESLFQIRMENREIKFFKDPLETKYFGRVVVLKENMIPIYSNLSMEKIIEVRRSAKERVFVENALRALKQVAPMNNIRNISSVVMVGGSALDFEIPDMILKELSKYKIIAGRGNIRGVEGPRNAVATGLVMSSVIK
jgi:diol dehydratase reactivase alpha subunit